MNNELTKKIDRSIRLLQSFGNDGKEIEIAYSGGKDSDIILELAKMAGIQYRAIYKNTTIDPPGTIKHCRDNGVEVRQPKESFFRIVQEHGLPNRFRRFCCGYLKEYKILDKVVMGIRRSESTKRASRYKEPTECRFYGSKKEHVEVLYPILDWTDNDELQFINERNIHLAPVYYSNGNIDLSRRLGCMCCPLMSKKKRINQFKLYPFMVKAYIRALLVYREHHRQTKAAKLYDDAYMQFTRDVFFERQKDFEYQDQGLFGRIDYKSFLEDYFHITL